MLDTETRDFGSLVSLRAAVFPEIRSGMLPGSERIGYL